MTRVRRFGLLLAAVVVSVACAHDESDNADGKPPALLPGMLPPKQTNADAQPPAIPYNTSTPRAAAFAVRSWPHDTGAYTQGLVLDHGRLLESVGREGSSDVREVDASSGAVRRRTALRTTEFGEGIAVVGTRMYQLTWKAGLGHVYDAATLAPLDSFTYAGEGWGLATDGRVLYLSDGSSRIRVVDPAGFRVQRIIQVNEGASPVWMLNELEWVRGELWANIYETDFVARIDPASGRVLGWIDLSTLLTPSEKKDVADRGGVANGIAYDSTRDRLLVTGKLWPRLFEVDRLRAIGQARGNQRSGGQLVLETGTMYRDNRGGRAARDVRPHATPAPRSTARRGRERVDETRARTIVRARVRTSVPSGDYIFARSPTEKANLCAFGASVAPCASPWSFVASADSASFRA
jgi:glutaminyl-peptide cyclotransferase